MKTIIRQLKSCLAGTLVAIAAHGSAAWAVPTYQAALFAKYPNAAAPLANCIACHDGPSASTFTPFANAFAANGHLFNAALEALDSDGDGATNGAELTASPATNPGDPASRPVVVTTPTPTPTPAPASSLNYTAMWWNPAEAGWGINTNHQGDIVFATLFTYDATGAPLWLVMSNGVRQADGKTFAGTLYRITGPAFNANPFPPVTLSGYTTVGSMSIAFSSIDAATLTYTYEGVAVTKNIARQVFGTAAASCSPTTGSRAALTNYQDLWWNPAEAGWGLNVTHQNSTLFATLFTYNSAGRNLWLVMSAGIKQLDGSYLGDLYQVSGPAFNAQPFTPIGAANLVKTGTMRLAFTGGENGTLTYTLGGVAITKAITRQVFASPVPSCTSPEAPVVTVPTTPAPPTTPKDGPTLYANHCAACHGALASSSKAGATAARIQGAIGTNAGGMGYLSTLTAAEITLIADALAVVTPPPVSATCGSCHGLPPSTGRHSDHRRRSCSTCHGTGYSESTVNAATHRNGITEILASIGWTATTRSCANSCHGRENWNGR